LLIQAALIVHVIKSGRNSLWIWAIALLPMAGPIAYVVVELLPQLFRGSAARRARSGVGRLLDPDRELRRASAEVAISGNVDARRRLAEELYERGKFAGAIEVYAAGLTGIFEHDPTLLLGLARAEFAARNFTAARATLERLRLNNPEFKSTEARLLYARALEAEGALVEAESEYASIAPDYPGAEARLRFGMLLKRLGKADQARSVLRELLDSARLSWAEAGGEAGPPHRVRMCVARGAPQRGAHRRGPPRRGNGFGGVHERRGDDEGIGSQMVRLRGSAAAGHRHAAGAHRESEPA
jgi:hypothetical protein